MTFTKLTPVQSDWLFASLENNNSLRLTTASFKAANLQNVKPDTLAAVIVRLERVNLSFTELTEQQLTALFEKINSPNNLNNNLKDILMYNKNDTWEEVGKMKEAKGGHAVAVLEDVSQLCP